jgi:hypothetical protein
MSTRGLALVIQRLHDDPGFADTVAADPKSTLDIYDLDDDQRKVFTDACITHDDSALHEMASKAGLQWHEGHFHGVGSLPDDEPGTGKKGSS